MPQQVRTNLLATAEAQARQLEQALASPGGERMQAEGSTLLSKYNHIIECTDIWSTNGSTTWQARRVLQEVAAPLGCATPPSVLSSVEAGSTGQDAAEATLPSEVPTSEAPVAVTEERKENCSLM